MTIARNVLASLLLAGAGSAAQATEICMQPDAFADLFRLSLLGSDDNTLVFGKDLALFPSGLVHYAISLVGTVVPPAGPSSTASFAVLKGTNNTSFFGNHSDCTFDVQISGSGAPSLQSLSCEGRVPGIYAKSNIPMHFVDCNPASTASRALRPGRAAAKGLGE